MGSAPAIQPTPATPVPRALYTSAMAVAAALGVGAAGLAALGLSGGGAGGGGRQTAVLAGAAVAAGSVPTFVPALLSRSAGTFGMAVVAASMARMLLTLAIAAGFAQMRDPARQPFWGGIVAGVLVILVIESAVAIRVLSRMQRTAAERG